MGLVACCTAVRDSTSDDRCNADHGAPDANTFGLLVLTVPLASDKHKTTIDSRLEASEKGSLHHQSGVVFACSHASKDDSP